MDAVALSELVPLPQQGRVFEQVFRPGFADCAPSGRLRVDAVARWLQDVAYADVGYSIVQQAIPNVDPKIVIGGYSATSGGVPYMSGGRILAVGQFAGRGAEEIDAHGLLVTPGFVDVHTHYDAQATWSSRIDSSSYNGVTTVLIGNCGVGFAPCRPERREALIKLMEGVEDLPEVVLAPEAFTAQARAASAAWDAAEGQHPHRRGATRPPHHPGREDVQQHRSIFLSFPFLWGTAWRPIGNRPGFSVRWTKGAGAVPNFYRKPSF